MNPTSSSPVSSPVVPYPVVKPGISLAVAPGYVSELPAISALTSVVALSYPVDGSQQLATLGPMIKEAKTLGLAVSVALYDPGKTTAFTSPGEYLETAQDVLLYIQGLFADKPVSLYNWLAFRVGNESSPPDWDETGDCDANWTAAKEVMKLWEQVALAARQILPGIKTVAPWPIDSQPGAIALVLLGRMLPSDFAPSVDAWDIHYVVENLAQASAYIAGITAQELWQRAEAFVGKVCQLGEFGWGASAAVVAQSVALLTSLGRLGFYFEWINTGGPGTLKGNASLIEAVFPSAVGATAVGPVETAASP